MRSSCLLLGFCVAAGAACARPTLEEMVVDAGTEPMVSPGSDAGTPSAHDATVAAPKDADSTETGTPPPRDAGNGDPPDVTVDASTQTPDAGSTPVMEAACKSAAAPTLTKDLGNATLTKLTVAGSDSYAVVAPGATVHGEFSYSVSCSANITGNATFIGLDGSKNYACGAFVCTPVNLQSTSTSFTFTAPTEPGLYYIKGVSDLTVSPCITSQPKSGDSLQNVGAICVSN